ncbi:MAG TPA: hypothetical protein VKY56_07750 [Chloroflexota bacterium]|nr:hypothetical protein [Chloroflexota bacterium]
MVVGGIQIPYSTSSIIRTPSRTASAPLGGQQRLLTAVVVLLAVLAGGEAFFEHLRGSFCRRVMWTPVWIAPAVAGIGLASLYRTAPVRQLMFVAALASTIDGLLGFYLHLRGIHRMPGGLHNLQFNAVMGPPLLAPLLFCVVGFLGLIAAAGPSPSGQGR